MIKSWSEVEWIDRNMPAENYWPLIKHVCGDNDLVGRKLVHFTRIRSKDGLYKDQLWSSTLRLIILLLINFMLYISDLFGRNYPTLSFGDRWYSTILYDLEMLKKRCGAQATGHYRIHPQRCALYSTVCSFYRLREMQWHHWTEHRTMTSFWRYTYLE